MTSRRITRRFGAGEHLLHGIDLRAPGYDAWRTSPECVLPRMSSSENARDPRGTIAP